MPKPFRFTLEKVLDYRIQLEEESKLLLAKAQNAYQQQVDLVQNLRDTMQQQESHLYKTGTISVDEMWLWRQYKERLVLDIRQAEEKMLHLAQEVNRCRRDAVVKAKDTRLLEKLKQKKALRHAQEEERKEQNEFDEMATIRYQPQHL